MPIVTLIASALAIAALYWAREVVIPLALAVLLAFLLSPLVKALERHRVPSMIAVLLVVLLVCGVLTGAVQVIAVEMNALAHELPRYRGNIMAKIADIPGLHKGSALDRVQQLFRDVAGQIERQAPGESERPVPVVVQAPAVTWALPSILRGVASAGLVIVLLIFVLLRREDLRNRLIRLFGYERLALTTKALDDAGERITRYLVRQALINGSFGIGVGIGTFAIGVPYAALWGFVAGTLRFIPYAGPWIAGLLPALVSLAVFPGWTQVLLVVGIIVALELTIYVGIEPWLYGRSVGVSEVALLVGLAFWTWIWGPIGLVLGTPMTVCFVVLGKYVPGLAPVAMLLGEGPAMPAPLVFYQRLIARDQHEATRLALDHATCSSPEEALEDLLIPAIARMQRDHGALVLGDQDRAFVLETIESIARTVTGATAPRPDDALVPEIAAPDGIAARSGDGGPGSPVAVLGCPLNDDADEVALRLFGMLLDPAQHRMHALPSGLLASEVVMTIEREHPAAVCFGTVSGGLPQTRYLIKRLRARIPEIAIVVGQWGTDGNFAAGRDRLLELGANHVGSTLREVRAHLVALVHDRASAESPSADHEPRASAVVPR